MRYWSTGRRLALVGLVAVLGGTVFVLYTLFFWYQEVIVIAPEGIAQLEAVKPEQVETRWFPWPAVQPEALRRPEEAVGKYARRPLAGGQAFLASDLTAEPPADTLLVGGIRVESGHVLAGVKVDADSGLGGLLRPGSLVNLIAVPREPGPAALFAQKVLVVAIAGDQGQPPDATNGGSSLLGKPLVPGPARSAVAVLALTPEQALAVASRTADGRVVLSLTSKGAPDLALPVVQQGNWLPTGYSSEPEARERRP